MTDLPPPPGTGADSASTNGVPSVLPRTLRRRHVVLLVLLIVVGAISAFWLRPATQRELALEKLAPLVEELDIDYIHVTPWSLDLRGLRMVYEGAVYQVGVIDAGFNLFGLFSHTLKVGHVELHGAVLDLRELVPPLPAHKPFAGVLALLNQGYALVLDSIDARANVLLRGGHTIDLVLNGSGLAPLATGNLELAMRYAGPIGTQTADIRGTLAATQINRGRVSALGVELRTALLTQDGIRPEPLALRLRIEPAAESTSSRELQQSDGRQLLTLTPESIHIELALGVDEPALLEVDGQYRGEDGRFSADYTLTAATPLLTPYAGNSPLPDIASTSRGHLEIDTMTLKGTLTLDSTTRVSALTALLGDAPTVPANAALHSLARADFDATTFTLAELSVNVRDAAGIDRLQASLTAPIVVPYAAPRSVLEVPRELATIELGPVPLSWFDGLATGYAMTGELRGRYALMVDEAARLKLNATADTTLADLRVAAVASPAGDGAVGPDSEAATAAEATPADDIVASADEEAAADAVVDPLLFEALTVTMQPTASWSSDFVRFALNDIKVASGDSVLANLNVKAASKSGGEPPRSWRYRVDGELDYDALGKLPVIARRVSSYRLPAGLGARFKALIQQRADTLSIEKAEIDVHEPAHPEALQLRGLRPFNLVFTDDGVELTNRTGELATVATRGFELAWLNPLLPDVQLAGSVAAADLVLTAPSAGTLSLTAMAPLRIERLAVQRGSEPLVRDLGLTVSSYLMYSADAASISLSGISVTSGGHTVLSGGTELAISGLASNSPRYLASGKLTVDVAAAAMQPFFATALSKPLPALPIEATTDFAIDVAGDSIATRNAHAEVRVGERGRVVLEAEPGLVVKTRLGAGEKLAQYFVGAAALDIEHLSSATLGEFLTMTNIHFAEINSSLRVRSDGTILRANTVAPLGVDAIRINDGAQALVHEFSVRSDASLRVEQDEVRVLLEDLVLIFASQPAKPAVAGHVRMHIEPGRTVPLTMLSGEMRADLPQLLEQPAVMPGHKLKGGTLTMTVEVDDSRKIAANIELTELAAKKPLAIETFKLPVAGELAADGRGFDVTAPLVGRGKSGPSDADIVVHYAPQPDEPRVLRIDVASEVFYLNDILASITAINPRGTGVVPVDGTKRVKIALNQVPDETAVWKVVPAAVIIDVHIDKLFYSDYLAFTEVGGILDLRRTKLALKEIRAHFHDSAIKLNGATRFKAGLPEPYQLDLTGTVKDFDLNQFFAELVPGEKPRIKGLFGGDIKAFGAFPNFSQLRNNVLFDVVMTSRDGLFRPLPPGSGLLVGASDLFGLVGETLSYVPTGAFGAGAVARLVNYISRIEYDTIDIHLLRDERRDIIVEQFLVLSPTVALTATGGVKYEPGKDLLDSALELNAHLDMLGRGAAILYSMDLMQDEKNDFGYQRGPEFRIWGTPAEPQSNFDEIVERAGDGTLKGAITRPISGLIGNLRYRWFNNDSRARESAQQHRREQREALEAGAAAADKAAAARAESASDGQ